MARLERFKTAQNSPHSGFPAALDEIRTGRKSGHWIWYIFPQLAGLGSSGTSHAFAIDDEEEAADYLRDPELRSRLLTMTRAVAEQLRRRPALEESSESRQKAKSLRALMGSEIDARKVVSSLTLFGHVAKNLQVSDRTDELDALVAAADEVLAAALFEGYAPCVYTLRHLRQA